MGNTCTKVSENSNRKAFGISSIPKSSLSTQEEPISDPSTMIKKFIIDSDLSEKAKSLLTDPILRREDNRILGEANSSLPSFGVSCFLEIEEDLDSRFVWYKLFSESSFDLSAELCHLFDLNINQEELKFCDEGVETFEVVDRWVEGDSVASIYRLVTRNNHTLDSLEALLVNVKVKGEAKMISSFSIGVDRTELARIPKYKNLIANISKSLTVDLCVESGRDTPSGCVFSSYTKIEPKCSAGKYIMQPYFRRTCRHRYEKYSSMLVMFLMTCDPECLIWFGDNKSEKKRILLENLQTFSQKGFPKQGFSSSQVQKRIEELKSDTPKSPNRNKESLNLRLSVMLEAQTKMSGIESEEFFSVLSR